MFGEYLDNAVGVERAYPPLQLAQQSPTISVASDVDELANYVDEESSSDDSEIGQISEVWQSYLSLTVCLTFCDCIAFAYCFVSG